MFGGFLSFRRPAPLGRAGLTPSPAFLPEAVILGETIGRGEMMLGQPTVQAGLGNLNGSPAKPVLCPELPATLAASHPPKHSVKLLLTHHYWGNVWTGPLWHSTPMLCFYNCDSSSFSHLWERLFCLRFPPSHMYSEFCRHRRMTAPLLWLCSGVLPRLSFPFLFVKG